MQGISKINIGSLRQACNFKLKYLCNGYLIHYTDDGDPIKIFGTPYCHIYGTWPFMRDDEYMEKKFAEIPFDVDIVISHDAPYGATDICMENIFFLSKGHIGNEPLRNRLEQVNYSYCFHGHLHSSSHEFEQLGSGLVCNVSILDERCNVAFPPTYIDFKVKNDNI